MNTTLINRIQTILLNEGNELFSGKPATREQVNAAEIELGVHFAIFYRDFLENFGGSFVGIPIYGFNNCAMLPTQTVTEITKDYRSAYNNNDQFKEINNCYVISIEGNGDPIAVNENGNVLLFCHDSGEIEVLSDNLENFIEENLFE